MPLTKAHKQETRESILASAVKLFSSKGYDNVSIDDLMSDAGLTRGGFYAHFQNKSELYVEAIINGAKQSAITQKYLNVSQNNRALEEIIKGYLAQGLGGENQWPCPLAFLATDVANRDKEVRGAYTRVYKGFVHALGRISEIEQKDSAAVTAKVIAILMIGGVAVGRALNDEKAAQQLVDACQKVAVMLAYSGSAEHKVEAMPA